VTVAWAQPEALLMLGLTSRGEGKPAVPVELVRIEF
jgi:hypothetical protein